MKEAGAIQNSRPRANGAKGIDTPPRRRPGVPMESVHPKPVGAAHWTTPERQEDPGTVQKRSGLDELTPVFGTAIPPRGLSGWMRKAAYRIPEHKTTHWLMLLFADRVDAIEHAGIERLLPLAIPALAGGAALLVWRRAKSRR